MLPSNYHGPSPGDGPHFFVGDKLRSNSSGEQHNKLWRPRVLIVEYRDEIYASVKTLLNDQGCEVARTELGATVVHALGRFAPDLIIVNQDMPDESGWLIVCKLRLARHGEPIWLYTVREHFLHSEWKELSGADEVIKYEGDLVFLLQSIQRNIVRWLGETVSAHGDNRN